MTDSLARRGPDGEGTHRWPSAVLGHRRLSIFDLSRAGRQPMLSPDGQVGVVFNGAVYNFLELRTELERKGYQFHSQTDTEVLVHGYDAWGIDTLVARLRGMFAFAVWDARRHALTLARDRLGVKPLIYVLTKSGIAFASTTQALHDADFVHQINDSAVLDFMEFGWIPDQRTIFRDAVKLPAATIVEWQGGKITQRKYWTVPPASPAGSISFDDAVEATETALVEAVRLRLFADVPVGTLLSGGIDSTLVCWAMAKLNANLTAFTIGTPGDPADEASDACRTARLLGIPHEVIELPPAEQSPIDDLVSAYGEPFASTSALGMLRVSKAVKPRVTVLLTGDGGDDIFLGYPRHRHMLWAQRVARSMPEPVAQTWPYIRKAIAYLPQLRRPMHFLDYATQGLGSAATNDELLGFYRGRDLIGPRLRESIDSRPSLSRSFASARHLLPEFLEHEWRTQFTGEYMTKVDGATMFHAVEARSPFLDHLLWELAASFPYNVRLHRGVLKAVLRQIVRRRVGREVAIRRKRGFTIPVESWLSGEWKAELREFEQTSVLDQDGWIPAGAVQNAVREATKQGRVPAQLWRLLVLERWLKSHVRQSVPVALA